MRFSPGQRARFRAIFRDEAKTLTNPSTTVFTVRDPAGAQTTYTLGVDSQVTQESVGTIRLDLPITSGMAAGTWRVRVVGTGACADATEQSFQIVASSFS